MKKTIPFIIFICLLTSAGLASYTYEVYAYGDNKILSGTQSIFIDYQGGMDGLTLKEQSSAMIEETSSLAEGFGGIWRILMIDNSSLYISSGQVNMIDISHNATATLTGGHITGIFSYQSAWKYAGDPPTLVPNPHITIVYSGMLPTRNPTTQMLTGLWGDGSSFSIYLPNISGYSPAMENIKFTIIPEPMTLALLALGGLWIRRK